MPKHVLDEREFELINIIGKELANTQRDLSRHLDLSLGQTNMLIRRLVAKGYIRITQINKKKVQYLLTPKGMAEKIQKTVKYTRNTINSIGLIQERLRQIVADLYSRGCRRFYVYAEKDLMSLIRGAFQQEQLADCEVISVESIDHCSSDGVLLIGREKVGAISVQERHKVDLIEEISKGLNIINFN